jgi:REP element-mobilizing transposase RayT
MLQPLKSKFDGLRHVCGARLDEPWRIYHIRTSTLDQNQWLRRDDCARLFIEELYHYRSKCDFRLFAYVVMPEHVHLVLMPTETCRLSRIMKLLKQRTAWVINKKLPRNGSFWLGDYFDHWARNDGQITRYIDYIHNNPVRRGLVARPEDYPYSSALAWIFPEKTQYPIDREWPL